MFHLPLTDNKGKFELNNLPSGEFKLLFTHINYHSLIKYVALDGTSTQINLGSLMLSDKSVVLSEVTLINETAPVTLVGDTIQYHAGAFKVAPNGNVEDLLKKLPGVKVDKDGTVKAQGEKVKKVLVDGKEFFGNDPKVATKNLPADLVDKVQVYNKQSDQAQLTGFDDGNSEKTINLKLKKEKKKGAFGKINGGIGTDNRYQAKGNVNSFKAARQMSIIGTANNTNTDGFSIMDILNFTGELSRMMKGNGGGVNLNINVSDDGSNAPIAGMTGNNTGINSIWGSGINYNNIIGTKTDFTSNYFYNSYHPYAENPFTTTIPLA